MVTVQEHLRARGLSKSEARVVEKILVGYANKEAAWQLGVTEACVKWHLTNVYKKTETKERKELIRKLNRWGIYGKKS